ncbi:hypothetical protein LTR96_011529 [Exophiala xenobiotica]|nr:hypothetical protein LTR96_011529 [Exophiala xenobiotica]KAK5344531.1 hypothetical protein LTR61_011699 [Exophiala xenobiotica]
MRAQFNGLVQALAPQYLPPSPEVQTADHDVDSLKLRVYTPRALSSEDSMPVGIFSHGGGYVMGNLDSEDRFCRAIVENTGTIIVSVDWVYRNAFTFHGDRSKILTIGSSAGAGLALSVARAALLGHNDLPKDEIRESSLLHRSRCTQTTQNRDNVPVIDKSSMDEFYATVAVQPTDASYFVGLDEDNQKSFPPTYVVTCEFDPLRDDGAVFVASVRSGGREVKHNHYSGLPHCFWLFPTLPETKAFLEDLYGGIKWVRDSI